MRDIHWYTKRRKHGNDIDFSSELWLFETFLFAEHLSIVILCSFLLDFILPCHVALHRIINDRKRRHLMIKNLEKWYFWNLTRKKRGKIEWQDGLAKIAFGDFKFIRQNIAKNSLYYLVQPSISHISFCIGVDIVLASAAC